MNNWLFFEKLGLENQPGDWLFTNLEVIYFISYKL